MKSFGKRLTAWLLALCMVLGLAACGGNDNSGDAEPGQISGTVYVPTFVDLDSTNFDYINAGCCDGQNVYVVASVSEEEEVTDPETGETYTNYTYRSGIFRISLDGQEVEELENYAPSIDESSLEDGWFDIESIRTGKEGTLWVVERVERYLYDLPADFDPETDDQWNYMSGRESSRLHRQLDSTGNELQRIETSGLEDKLELDYIEGTVLDDEGCFYISGNGSISVLDKDANLLFTLTAESMWGEPILLSDGTVGVRVYDSENGQRMKSIDKAAKDWGADYPMSMNSDSVYAGSGQYLFYYTGSDALFGYNTETMEGEKLLSWSAADINVDNILFFTLLSDGRVVAMTRDWSSSGSRTELAVLTETDASALADKTILTYATMYLDYNVRAQIIDFNKKSDKYRIEIRDYSEYNTDEDYQAGLTKLNTEILAGNVPDILATGTLPLQQYGAKGLLEDLWPYIDNDSELSREQLMERVLEAAEQDGKLYQIFDGFTIRTVVGSPQVVGDEMGWTLADMQDALASMPEGCQLFDEYNTKSGMLQVLMAMDLDRYVDWSTGECRFDSPEFIAALEFCNTFPLEFDWNSVDWEEREGTPKRIASGKQMLLEISLSDVGDLQMYEAMFGGAVTFIGYPTEDGSCGSSFIVNAGLAMSSTCKDKEGAWSFMRQILLPDGDDSNRWRWGLSTNKENFEKAMEEWMRAEYVLDENGEPMLDENGEPIQESKGGWGWDDLMIEMVAATQEEYDQFMALYNAIDSLYSYDTSIYDIVNDLASAYFSGDKSVEETAGQIQSRVKIYVNEQK